MRIANLEERAILMAADGLGIDIAAASRGRFGPDPQALFDDWDDLTAWAAGVDRAHGTVPVDPARLGAPSPRPRQVVAIGLNYDAHAAEAGFDRPTDLPPVFTKFPTSITGPVATVVLPPEGHTDWEVEAVVVVGRTAQFVDENQAWSYVAGLTVGQDLSERISQLRGPVPQFSLGKSFAGFAPVGPWLVTPDELPDRDDLVLGCKIGDDVLQVGQTANLLWSVPQLISGLTRTMTLLPGDMIFTGTPEGVGHARKPPRYLTVGETLISWIEGIGEISQTFVEAPR